MPSTPHHHLYETLRDVTRRVARALQREAFEELAPLMEEHASVMNVLQRIGLSSNEALSNLVHDIRAQMSEVVHEAEKQRRETARALLAFGERKRHIAVYAATQKHRRAFRA